MPEAVDHQTSRIEIIIGAAIKGKSQPRLGVCRHPRQTLDFVLRTLQCYGTYVRRLLAASGAEEW